MSRHRRRLSRRQRGILKMKRKLALLFVVIVLLLMGIIVRLVYINRVSGEQYKKRVLAQQDTKSQTLPYKRGDIYDRNGTVLATSEKVYNLILDPGVLWKNYDEDAKKDCVEPTLSGVLRSGSERIEYDYAGEKGQSLCHAEKAADQIGSAGF